MKERPIIFSTPMVQAILARNKTMTRRVIKPQPLLDKDGFWQWSGDVQWKDGGLGCPQSAIDDYASYKPGDILWLRETWKCVEKLDHTMKVLIEYKSDNEAKCIQFTTLERYKKCVSIMQKWWTSIFLQHEAPRILLEVKSVRVEQLQDISEKDAKAEGVNKAYNG